jgi:hypothetical protein
VDGSARPAPDRLRQVARPSDEQIAVLKEPGGVEQGDLDDLVVDLSKEEVLDLTPEDHPQRLATAIHWVLG